MHITFVDDADAVPRALAELDEPVVGVDVERADGDRYFRAAALVQVGVTSRCVLLDALAIADLSALDSFLDGRLVVLHALENDLDPLASSGVHPERVADTAIAAMLLGLPTGLSPLLHELLEVPITEEKERFQRADWTARPLTDELQQYAAGDVVHLPAAWADLERRLEEAGRTSWYAEELAASVERAGETRRAWTRVRGTGKLDGRGRAILRALWEEREAVARQHDVAPQRLIRDEVMVDLSQRPPRRLGDLPSRGVRRAPARDYGARFIEAIQRGADAPAEKATSGLRRSDRDDRKRYDRLRHARSAVAQQIGVDSGVLCPSQALWRAVLSDPDDPDELVASAGLRQWQAGLLRDVLWEAFTLPEEAESADEGDAGTGQQVATDDGTPPPTTTSQPT